MNHLFVDHAYIHINNSSISSFHLYSKDIKIGKVNVLPNIIHPGETAIVIAKSNINHFIDQTFIYQTNNLVGISEKFRLKININNFHNTHNLFTISHNNPMFSSSKEIIHVSISYPEIPKHLDMLVNDYTAKVTIYNPIMQ